MPDSVRDQGPADRRETAETTSRRSLLTVGVPAMIAVAVVGAVPFVIGRSSNRIRSADAASSSSVTTTDAPSTTADLFSPGRSSNDVAILPGSTTNTTPATTTTSTTTTSSTAPSSTLPTEPDAAEAPIDPPSDPRGHEDEVLLGGLAIPKLGVDEPLYQGIRLTTLDKGPGHWPGTALPGAVGNVVVAAHRTSHGGPFRNIDQLVEGDRAVFTTADGTIEYAVTSTQVVEPDALWIVDPTEDATATLFACHPPGSVRQRIVVKLALV
jgi:sortase A